MSSFKIVFVEDYVHPDVHKNFENIVFLYTQFFSGTTDSSVSEEDAVPPPLPIKHNQRETDYANIPANNENYSFLYSHRNSSMRNSLQIKTLSTVDTLEINFDDSDVPPTPPPKPPKIKNSQSTI